MLHFVGIDVSKDKLDCAWLRDVATGKFKNKVINNTQQGYHALEEWLLKNIQSDADTIVITLEPTGVYHDALAHYLHAAGFKLLMVNPGKAKAFARSQNQRGKTDKKDSTMLAHYGSVSMNNVPLWIPMSPEIRPLKVMMRRLDALEKDLQRELNRLEAFGRDSVSERVIASIDTMVEVLKQEIGSLKKDIDAQIDCHPQLKKDRALLETVPGIGQVVSRELVVLFSSMSFTSAKQAAAYLGLNPVPQESGKFKGRSMLSQCGPSRIRAKLYMAAITASQYNVSICAQYQRLQANGKTKMQALCAAMRKLVQIGFGVIKQQCDYQPLLVN